MEAKKNKTKNKTNQIEPSHFIFQFLQGKEQCAESGRALEEGGAALRVSGTSDQALGCCYHV